MVALVALCIAWRGSAAVSFPDLFGDHAIIQKATDARVWGRAEPGETVDVALGTVATTAVADSDGWWLATLDTSALGDGPFQLTARAPSGSAASSDILVGETWLAGGQSNMEFKMDSYGNMVGFDEIRAACTGRPIRMFRLSNIGESEPVAWDARGTWRVVSPTNIGDITAVGYTFIDAVQRTIGGAAGVIDISVSGTRCWAWLPRATINAFPELKAERLSQEAAAANGEHVSRPVEFCWNNRFFPVSKLSCCGILWYQGEDDAYQPDGLTLYQKWFSRMAEDMRSALGDPDLPFLYCQIAGWRMPASTPGENPGPAQLREAQRRVRRSIPRSAMAVTLDQSEYEIHGRFKKPVGERLAALALHWVYGQTGLVCESPDFLRAEFRASDALLTFANGGSPLAASTIRTEFTWNAQSNTTIRLERRSSPESQLEGFVLLGGGGHWRWADAEIVGPDTVRVWADGAESPAAVRYCWGHQGFGNLVNESGFPASPFAASTSNPGVSADNDFANVWRIPTTTSTNQPQGDTTMNYTNIIATSVITTAVALATSSLGDVYSNAFYWARGMGHDYNGDGFLYRNDYRDSLNRQTDFADTTSRYDVYTQALPLQKTETIRFPYRGVERNLSCAYFPQQIVEVNGALKINSCILRPPASVGHSFTNDNYTIALRFRPDVNQPQAPVTLLRIAGDDSKRGFWLDLTSFSESTVGNATNHYAQLWFYCGDKGYSPGRPVALGDWNDIVISVGNRTNATVLVSRGGNLWDGPTNSDMASTQTFTWSFHTDPGYVLSAYPGSTWEIVIGGYRYDCEYVSCNSSGKPTDSQWKSGNLYRGYMHSFAVWTNALTTAQMREAAAWPRTDLWRVGVEDGAANEFNGSGASATVDVDENHWMLQKNFAAGASATFRFPLDAVGEAKAPQLLRVKAATDSAEGKLSVSVNGTVLPAQRTLGAGGNAIWFVPETMLRGGLTNTIVLTRIDGRASPVKFDAVSFGGSLQYGLDDGHWWEFAEETKIQNSGWCQYNLIGGNWFDGARALYRANSGSEYTSTTLFFDIPDEIIERGHRWMLKFKMLNAVGDGHRVSIVLNNTGLGEFAAGVEHDVRVPKGLVQATGNMLKFSNVSTGGASGDAMAPDFMRLYLVDLPQESTVVYFR